MNLKKNRINISLLAMTVVMLSTFTYVLPSARSQTKEKILEYGKDFDPPVKITLVKSKIGGIETDKKILAGDDWLKGLTIRVRNESDKVITGLIIDIRFRRPVNEEKRLDLIAPIPYGETPLNSTENPPLPAEPILPRQTKDITMSDQAYDSVRQILDNLGYPASIKSVKLQVKIIGFQDGTYWNAGGIFRQDPNNPNRWVRDKQAQAHAKKKPNP